MCIRDRADTGADRAQYIGAPAWYILGGDLTPINSPLSLLKFQAKDAPPQEYTVVLAPVRRSVSLQDNVNLAGNASTPPFFPTRLGAFGVTATNVNDGNSIVRVRWGDGRIGQEAWFNYPAAGAVFSCLLYTSHRRRCPARPGPRRPAHIPRRRRPTSRLSLIHI